MQFSAESTTKYYLRHYREDRQYIKSAKVELRGYIDLVNLEAAPASPCLSSTGGGGGEKQSVEERAYLKTEQLQAKISDLQQRILRVETQLDKVKDALDALESFDTLKARIVRERYLNGRTWTAIALENHVSYGTCCSLAEAGIQSMARMIFGPEPVVTQLNLINSDKV